MEGANNLASFPEVFIELGGALESTFNEYLSETIHLGQISNLIYRDRRVYRHVLVGERR
jgi:hypothetical protein